MATTNIYLLFKGNCEEAFNFYKSAFGVEFDYLSRFCDITSGEKRKVSAAYKNQIMHVSLPIGNSFLMGSDCGEEFEPRFVQGNNFSVSVTAATKDEADILFNRLAEGGVITMPLTNTFWGDYFGMLTDKFDVNWMVGFNEKQQ